MIGFVRWRRNETWEGLLTHLQSEVDAAEELEWTVSVGEPEEVSLAAKAGLASLGEDGEGEELAVRERGRTSRLTRRGRMSALPPLVHEHVQGHEHGFEAHPAILRPQNREAGVSVVSASRADTP